MKTLNAFSINDIPLPAFKLKNDGKINAVNEQAIVLLGYQSNELVDVPFELLFDNQQFLQSEKRLPITEFCTPSVTQAILKSKTKETFKVSLQITKREGEFLVLCLSSIPVNSGVKSNTFDCSNKAIVDQLKQQNGYLELAEKVGNSGCWQIDLVKNTVFWSPGVYQIHGVDEDAYKPTLAGTVNFYIEKERERVAAIFQNSIDNKEGFYFKSVIVKTDGVKIKVESIGDVELDDSGQLKSILVVLRDITEMEVNYEKLKLLAMVNYTEKVPVFFINESDNLVHQDINRYRYEENKNLFSYVNFTTNDYLQLKKLAKAEHKLKRFNISYDNYTSVFDLSVTYESESSIYIWIVENVTEKYRLEQQQAISNRLGMLGNTFGSVSHDINNVLGVALGSIEMLELKYSQGEKDISSYISRVKNAIYKGKNVTERLLEFTHKPSVKIVNFDPVKEIRENKYLFEQLLLKNIKIKYAIKNVDCNIHFPQGEFINILLNLVLNSQDAIQNKGINGQIEISANIVDENKLEIHVIDNGVGITNENLTKVFDPFYSIKSVNKGNGIGLANAYNTMYKNNGHIQVKGDSKLGGAHFILTFKCQVGLLSSEISVRRSHGSLQGKRILVLDDEVSIAEFVGLYLDSLGAEVICVNNKLDLERQVNIIDDIDIFITDMIMPDLSGAEAVDIVKNKFSQVTIYSMSGYMAIENNGWEYPVLRKPFNSEELSKFLTE
ncbi:hypothetical protein A3Q34_19885 [Colwellia sp. PAMC 20917]|uniref:ATP-binding protein n=1 Tax=Colwellia sp. PAMC 20917 TaxID=1816218 RepID=UPI000878FDD2|nr:ATP-binding protein [Colwellia sp. PAMC 20917]AOW78904.1 hypothetical protein A3Q34_19885 [Colwellia sp. PAMC 20917]